MRFLGSGGFRILGLVCPCKNKDDYGCAYYELAQFSFTEMVGTKMKRLE